MIAAARGTAALRQQGRWLVCTFADEHRVASWAVCGGGVRRARAVVWHQVRDAELGLEVDPVALFRGRLAERGLDGAVGLLTSRRLDRHATREARSGAVSALCVATVGLGNAVRIGSPVCRPPRVGTINLLCRVSVPLSDAALLEALSLCAEARTAAMLRARVRDRWGGLATGTGTDCAVVAAPLAGEPRAFAGKHTDVGAAIGRAVADAIFAGAWQWKQEQAQASGREEARRVPVG